MRSALALAIAFALAPARAEAQEASRWAPREALLFEATVGFVPYANDVPLMLGIGIRARDVHEVWARVGWMPTGDDVGWGFGCFGYRAALRPGKLVRPLVGGLFAAIPATCGHDEQGRPTCEHETLYIAAATGGLRLEPLPWLGIGAIATFGVDSYPNPFGMIEITQTFALPL